MYIDDLPVWGILGDVEEVDGGQRQYYVWTHKKFNIGYNGDQIVDINLTSDGKVHCPLIGYTGEEHPQANYCFIYIAEWQDLYSTLVCCNE